VGIPAGVANPGSCTFILVASLPDPRPPQASATAGQDYCDGHGEMRPYCAPRGLRTQRSRWVVPRLLLLFVVMALAVQLILRRLTYRYGHLIAGLAGLHDYVLPKAASVAVRPLTIAVLVLFAAFAAGSVWARARLALLALIIYLPLMVVVDVILAKLAVSGGPSPFVARGNIIDGLLGILAACFAFFAVARLPANLYLKPVLKRPVLRYSVILVASIASTVVTVNLLYHFEKRHLHVLSVVPLLGGLLSVVVLSLALFPLYLCAFGFLAGHFWARHPSSSNPVAVAYTGGDPAPVEHPLEDLPAPGDAATEDPAAGEHDTVPPAFGFLVPAHNEEGRITHCVRAIDSAAGESDYPVTIYVIENGSTDATYEEAQAALADCQHARGVLLTSATDDKARAKAHALNTGLAASTEPWIVRVDADTFVSATLLNQIAPHFSDPDVGGVGTLPLPHKETIWIERMRAIEVYYGSAFKRTAQGAVDAIPVLPGATVAFRRDLLVRVNGFSEGILGEDSDITVRVGRLAYRIVSDPAIRVYSEQPQNFLALREQRMRWAGGLLHMIGHNRSAITHLQGLRGVWTMPWACFVMFRKVILIPFAVAIVALVLTTQSFFPLREFAAAGAIALGAQLIAMAVVIAVLAGPSRIISLPSYIVFRLIVTYFALETLFAVVLKDPRWRLPGAGQLRSRLRWPVT
jgi:cellulose synthase/poly-beta-1,6-N-acetylglucosamine synthase-like glycosyltransferase